MAQISDPVKLIHLYQKSLEKYSSTMDVKKLTYYIGKLSKMPITVKHLQDTGIGRTVNSLRKLENEAGDAARSLVMKWKEMVIKEDSVPGSNDSDRDEEEEEEEEDDDDDDDDDEEDENSEEEIESSQNRTDTKSKERESGSKEKNSSLRNSSKIEKCSSLYEKNDSKFNENNNCDNIKHKSKHSDSESEYECNNKQHSKSESSSGKHKHHSSSKSRHEKRNKDKHSSQRDLKNESRHKSDDKRADSHSSKRKHENDSCDDTELKKSKYEKKKHKKSVSDKSNDEIESKHKIHKNKKHTSDDSSDDEEEQKYQNKKHRKYDSDSCSENESKYKSEKRRHKKHESDYSDDSDSKNYKTDEKSKHNLKRKSENEEDYNDSKSKKEKNDSKIKEKSKRHEKHSHSYKSAEHKKSDKREKEKSSNKSDDKEKSSAVDKRSQKETEKRKIEKDKTSKSKSDGSKHKKSKLNSNSNEDGIDCGSGASFAEALGMLEPTPPKISTIKKKTVSTPKPHVEETMGLNPSTSKTTNNVPPPLIESPFKLEPVDINISSLLPPITPNYRPLGICNEQIPRTNKAFSDEALAKVMSSKNQRTKVYSGNKSTWNKVPSLFEICVRVLQDNMDAFEYTGGVPYSLLKPVLEKATPDQLFMMEHHNPYLIEDTDELWYLHCQKEFKSKKREELETWREMYMRCLDEREARLKALTANIKMSQDKSTPVRQTKLAYVDNYVKPPRQIAKKQAKNGIVFDKTPTVTATSKLNAIAASSSAGQITVPNPGTRAVERRSGGSNSMIKPKKAPLMQKTLASMKNRFRR